MAATNEATDDAELNQAASRAPADIVVPPAGILMWVDRIAGYVARNGAPFEDRIRTQQGQQPKMSFIWPDDAYHPYYQWRLAEIKAGRGTSTSSGQKDGGAAASSRATEVSFQGKEKKVPEKPDDFAFSARMPILSAQDLEVVKLTALFVAKNGRSWMTQLSQREAGNYQFDFLRPQHSLYQFFSRLVDQYTDLLTGDSVDNGRPQKKRMAELEANVQNRFRMLDRAKKRAAWVKYQEEQKVAAEELEEAERIAHAQIDWHDFVVVETVLFDERDDQIQLPAPTTKNDIMSASLEQKAAMRVDASHRLEEAMPSVDDFESFYGQSIPTPIQQQIPQRQTITPQPPPPAKPESDRLSTLHADRARAKAAQEAAKANPNSLRIRQNYVPAAQARAKAQNTSICPNCKQSIPNDEMEEHMKIEMLHPDWREQYQKHLQRSSTTNLSTADVAGNLKRLASQRTDVFDPVTGQMQLSAEEMERRRLAEERTTQAANEAAALGGQHQFQQQQSKPTDVQEQIRLIHERARNG